VTVAHNIMGRIRMHNLEMAGDTILPSQNVIAGTLITNGYLYTDLYVLVGRVVVKKRDRRTLS